MNVFCIIIAVLICIYAFTQKNKEKFAKTSFIIEKYEKQIVFILLLLGILVRIMLFWKYPAGLNQDEASVGYDAFADLVYGIDRNGYHNPVYSVAWGSGHCGLFIALLKPFIKLFGLCTFSVRIVNVLFGCLALFAFYGTVKELRGRTLAVIALFLLVINPWHIMMCRWGLDCNLFPNIFFVGLYALVKGREKNFFYYISAFIFGLCIYSYGTSYMFMPVFLLTVTFYLVKRKELTVKNAGICAGIFLVTVVPIVVFMTINVFNLQAIQLKHISFPKLVDGRYNTTVTVLSGEFFYTVINNLKTFLYVLIKGYDGLIWNSIPFFGTLYHLSWPFIITGLICLFKKEGKEGRKIIVPMLLGVFVLACLTSLNINRGNIAFIILIYLCAEGIYFVFKQTKYIVYGIILTYFVFFLSFTSVYFTKYQAWIGDAFFEGFGQAVLQATKETEDTVYLTEKVNGPYVYALFYDQTNPAEFMDTVQYLNPDSSVRYVKSFGRFVTGIPEELSGDEICIVSEQEAEKFDEQHYRKEKFKKFYMISLEKNLYE